MISRARGLFPILLTMFAPAAAAADAPPAGLTLEQAVQEALTRSPVLRARRAVVAEAEGRLVGAGTYPHDPELIFEGARRTDDLDTTTTDEGLTLVQVIAIGGQRGRRKAQASAELEETRARLLGEERLLRAQVSAAFVEALRARDLMQAQEANAELARSLLDISRARFEAGSAPQMDVNLAQVQVGRSDRDMRMARGAYDIARSILAETIGLDPVQPPEPQGGLELPERAMPPIVDLVDGAVQRRADLQALRAAVTATRARIEVAHREVVPNLAFEAFRREDDGDRLIGGALGIRIPIFNRNQGAIAEARAAEGRAIAESEAAILQARREVMAARTRYEAASEAADRLRQQALGTLDENLRLLQLSFESGKTGWTDVLVFRREFVDVRRDYVNTLAEARLAAIELDLAAGHPAP
jgi:cobalt-zinc-cadmium efflux system outer membrane protein